MTRYLHDVPAGAGLRVPVLALGDEPAVLGLLQLLSVPLDCGHCQEVGSGHSHQSDGPLEIE